MKDILDRALAARYGVAAFNIVNDLTIEAVLAAAVAERAPVILQTSVKTVRMYGRRQLHDIFGALAHDVPVPVTLHLDHCPDRAVISDCLRGGWNSVLFDAHELRRRGEPAADHRGRRRGPPHGAHVEGEIEGIRASRTTSAPTTAPRWCRAWRSRPTSSRRTGVHCFAPAIGNAHGSTSRPRCWTPSGSATWSRPPASRWPCTAAPGCPTSSSPT
jgi:fructose-bisphosphate aldolase class II